MKYLKAYEELENESIKYIMDKYNFSSDLANYVFHLGYDTKHKIDEYLNPQQSSFNNPFLFPHMQAVVERINRAIEQKEKIVIFGDYDADGIGATYILLKFFEEKGLNANYFLPSRHKDGYGLTISSIDKILEEFKPNLIITVDCGITCANEVEYVKSKGVDIIITDHHEPSDTLPNCLTLDCKIEGQEYPFKCLCGAGMALKLVYALSDFETCKKYFTVCAISTIADIVELQDENRYIVKEGLDNYDKDCPEGLKYLIKQLKIHGIPTAKDISFKIAPKINATGRMGDASVALELYLENDKARIKTLYKKVIKMNEERQNLCNITREEIIDIVQDENVKNQPIIVLKNKNWECGILGIVCSKVVELAHKPVILLGFDERLQVYSGSARSYANFDLHSAISKSSSLLESFGGHKFACGLTIKEENFNQFKENLQENLEGESLDSEVVGYYDIDIKESKINFAYAKNLSVLEPFGVGNPEPLFKINTSSLTASPMNNHFEHLVLEFTNQSALYFGHSKSIYTLSFVVKKEIFFNINLDYFMRRPMIKLILKDYHCEEFKPFNKTISDGARLLTSIYPKKEGAEYSVYSSLNDIKEENSIYITFSSQIEENNFDEINYINLTNKGKKTLLVSPLNFEDLSDFSSIVFLEDLANERIISYLNEKYPNTKVYANISNENLEQIEIHFAEINQILCELKSINESIFDEIYLFKKYFNKLNIEFKNLALILYVLKSLGFYQIKSEDYKLELLINELEFETLKNKLEQFNIKLID